MKTMLLYSSVFSCQQVNASIGKPKPTKDEVAYAEFEPSDYLSNLQYDLAVNADGTSLGSNYWGRVYITMKCLKKTNTIFLDQKSIIINADTIKAWEHTETDDRKIMVHYGRSVSDGKGYKIKLEEYMQDGITYTIRLEFSKTINSENGGFMSENYRLPHPNLSDIPEEYLNQLSDFDLEKLKSTFCENKCEETSGNLPKIWVVDEFEKTHLISTFSLALAVVKLNAYEPTYRMIGPSDSNHEKVEIKIWAEEDILRECHVEEILRAAAQSLAYFSDFFDSKYKLGKLDLIILHDSKITVEDNYGLIYLGEGAVKYAFTESSHHRDNRYPLVSKICQSMSRHWIGHLVSSTPQEDWFYDGLNTYLKRLCVTKMTFSHSERTLSSLNLSMVLQTTSRLLILQIYEFLPRPIQRYLIDMSMLQIFPHWKSNAQLDLVDSFINLLRDEERGENYTHVSRLGNHPTVLNSETKSKINFVVRMLSFIVELRQNLLQKALIRFINQYEEATPSLRKMWSSWAQTTSAERGLQVVPTRDSLSSIAESWLNQSGYPLLKVVRNKADRTLSVHQEPFKFPDQKESKKCWPIPFDIMIENQPKLDREKVRHWSTCSEPEVTIPLVGVNEHDWIIVTSQLHVPGRVHYDQESWSLIQVLFHSEEISSIDDFTKVQLIHDMFTLAEASYLNYEFVFETMKYIINEKDCTCWHVAYQELRRVRSRWIGTSLFEPFQEFARNLIEPVLEKRVFEIDDFLVGRHSNNMLGRIIIQAACTFELPQCKDYSENLLNNLMNNEEYENIHQISEFFRESFYCMAMKNANDKKWEFLLKKYLENTKDTWMLRALGCSKNPKILKNFLAWGLTVKNSKKLPHLSLRVFKILSSSDEGYQLIIPYFKIRRWPFKNNNTIMLKNYISAVKTGMTIDDFFLIALKGAKKTKDLKLLIKFSKTLTDRKSEKAILEATEIAQRNISWFEREAKGMLKYFSNPSEINAEPISKYLEAKNSFP